jgi:hypothetical protein
MDMLIIHYLVTFYRYAVRRPDVVAINMNYIGDMAVRSG